MQQKYRILFIAPYAGMENLLQTLAQKFDDLVITTFVGDLDKGVDIARTHFHGDYDAVISRGGTTKMLRKVLELPVIDIEMSTYDILCALKLSGNLTGRTALITFGGISENARQLAQLMNYPIDFYTSTDSDVEEVRDIEAKLLEIQAKNYDAILCDASAYSYAKRMGMRAFLITSSSRSVERTLQTALLVCRSRQTMREENFFLRDLLHGQLSQTVVFDHKGNLFLSTLDAAAPELLDLLYREFPDSSRTPERRISRMVEGMLYTIYSRIARIGDEQYTAFFVEARKAPASIVQSGIRFFSRSDVEKDFQSTLFNAPEKSEKYQASFSRVIRSRAPVMISGEDGTGKGPTVRSLYMQGDLNNSTLITIQCSLLNEKSWAFLLEHHNSPLTDNGNSIYFCDLDVLVPERQQQLLAALTEMEVCRRNRVYFSCVCHPGEQVSQIGSRFMDAFHCLSLHLPSLRQTPELIPELVNLVLSQLNAQLSRQIVGVSASAMSQLQHFSWPNNYTQFHRVIRELASSAQDTIISGREVDAVLQKERHLGSFYLGAENGSVPLDLSKSLSDIEQEIVRLVLAEVGGNQTEAAKRLRISRTTLWRMLQQEQSK